MYVQLSQERNTYATVKNKFYVFCLRKCGIMIFCRLIDKDMGALAICLLVEGSEE